MRAIKAMVTQNLQSIYLLIFLSVAFALCSGCKIKRLLDIDKREPKKPKTATAVSAGGYYTCAVLSDGTIKCWGINYSSTPLSIPGVTTAFHISSGHLHSCAVLTGNTIKCAGNNSFGQLGDGTTTSSTSPVSVTSITNAVSVSAGGYHTCALLSNGGIKCWGWNAFGQLGDGTETSSPMPVSVPAITQAVGVACGWAHTCAVLSNGKIQCWGANEFGQLGDKSTKDSQVPVEVSNIASATGISAGYNHTCAVLTDGTIQCWGWNYSGQLGIGENNGPQTCNNYPCSKTPLTTANISNANAVSAGGNHSCVLLSGGTVECWGDNYYGQLGNGTTGNSYAPVPVSGITDATHISSGMFYHTCAILIDGTVRCWGWNGYGQLGNGTSTDSSSPVPVDNLFK